MKISSNHLRYLTWQTATLAVLRTLHQWIDRHYHRMLLRGALQRIGHDLAQERRRASQSTHTTHG